MRELTGEMRYRQARMKARIKSQRNLRAFMDGESAWLECWADIERDAIIKELDRVVEELKSYEDLFDLRWKADMRAIKRWQKETGRTDIWPDHADLVVYLMGKLDEATRAK